MQTLARFFGIIVLSFAIFSGCNEQTPTANSVEIEQSLLKPPASSGVVIRIQDTFIEGWYDAKSGLVVAFGAEDIGSLLCGNGSDLDLFDLQMITSPSNPDGDRIISKLTGDDINVAVWSGDGFPAPADYCNFFSNQPVASGKAKVSYKDNDLFGAFGGNTNAVNFSVNGKVMDADGKSFNLNAFYHLAWDGPDGTKLNFNTKVQLTPTGKK